MSIRSRNLCFHIPAVFVWTPRHAWLTPDPDPYARPGVAASRKQRDSLEQHRNFPSEIEFHLVGQSRINVHADMSGCAAAREYWVFEALPWSVSNADWLSTQRYAVAAGVSRFCSMARASWAACNSASKTSARVPRWQWPA
jgi:hypothetical protein